ncbi:ubiquitin C-terminal hydrolase family protein [Leptodontidium sp. MPI-SDFR-AT-0119]|nr:ubiquitin C-terminal hydrolase family protein [Leptodontidium sp. MPI-SDFR-AT-0119]
MGVHIGERNRGTRAPTRVRIERYCSWKPRLLFPVTTDAHAGIKPQHAPSFSSLSKAFSNLNGKSSPLARISQVNVLGTGADLGRLFQLQSRPLSSDGLSSIFKTDPQKKIEKEHAKEHASKVQAVKQRLKQEGHSDIKEEHINFALATSNADGSVEKAVQMLLIFQQSLDGVIKPYSPDVYMRGAINRNSVTCYIDSLLFAMFGKLNSFEPIILRGFEDEPKRRLAAILRVYVNMLRQGILIHTDITEQLQKALAECGWQDAMSPDQQDVSEAFNQLASILELPLLSLKVDLFHVGRDDDPDDHKIIQERLLDVAVPDEPPPGKPTVRLEDCLESYFNNRVTVMRRLERSNTNSSLKPSSSHYEEKGEASALSHINVNVSELNWSTPDTPITPGTPLTPNLSRDGGRDRATSIIRHVVIPEEGSSCAAVENTTVEVEGSNDVDSGPNPSGSSMRKGSTRKEVMMPAWQFFNLIPWSTDNQTKDNAAVAAHFSSKPVLGICLKRYGVVDGRPVRKNTLIDIPLDIRLPHFINDNGDVDEDGPLIGQFKLSLQSVVCHRGTSTSMGHYISFIRGTTPIVDGDSRSSRKLSDANRPPNYSEERWIKSDDLACPRVITVDIETALKNEMPYLLFYQVQPYENVSPPPGPGPDVEPPSYTDTAFEVNLTESTPVDNQPGYFDGARDDPTPSIRVSTDMERPQTPRRSINLPEDRSEIRRGSLAFTENSMASTSSSVLGTSAPVTPIEETTAQRMSRAASRFAKLPNKSRPTSQSGESRVENRLSSTFSRLNLMKSKEQLNNIDNVKHSMSTGDVASEPRKSITIEEPKSEFKGHLTESTPNINRSKSKKEKKRDKSKGPSEKLDDAHQHGHSHKDKGKGKAKDGVPDRECIIM